MKYVAVAVERACLMRRPTEDAWVDDLANQFKNATREKTRTVVNRFILRRLFRGWRLGMTESRNDASLNRIRSETQADGSRAIRLSLAIATVATVILTIALANNFLKRSHAGAQTSASTRPGPSQSSEVGHTSDTLALRSYVTSLPGLVSQRNAGVASSAPIKPPLEFKFDTTFGHVHFDNSDPIVRDFLGQSIDCVKFKTTLLDFLKARAAGSAGLNYSYDIGSREIRGKTFVLVTEDIRSATGRSLFKQPGTFTYYYLVDWPHVEFVTAEGSNVDYTRWIQPRVASSADAEPLGFFGAHWDAVCTNRMMAKDTARKGQQRQQPRK